MSENLVNKDRKASKKIEKESVQKRCGIVMPIADSENYPIGHWNEVYEILKEAISTTEFIPSLVSESLDIGLIHERIVNNLYNNEIVVCDVSSKNPNVMFELGLRLAFDKPTIIIKDEMTGYSFDTSPIEHISYPSSLRFSEIVKFKTDLVKKIEATYKKSTEDDSYSPFLKSFGTKIIPSKIEGREISDVNYIITLINDLREDLKNTQLRRGFRVSNPSEVDYAINPEIPHNFLFKVQARDLDQVYNFLKNLLIDNDYKFETIELVNGQFTVLVHNLFEKQAQRIYRQLQGLKSMQGLSMEKLSSTK